MERHKEEDDDDDESEMTMQYKLDAAITRVGNEALEELEITDLEMLDNWKKYAEDKNSDDSCHVAVLDQRLAELKLRTLEKIKNAPKILEEQNKSDIERQLDSSERRLNELINFGDELVTNIRVANDRREYERRKSERNLRGILMTDLRMESAASDNKFDNITKRWIELEAINEPMALWDQIQEQKEGIAAIMSSKDEMIERCQNEIIRLNEQFQYDRIRQAADLCCLVERVDNQVELLKDSYKNHLNMLEETIEQERLLFASNANEKWRQYFTTMNENFNSKSDVLRSREECYMQQTQRIAEQQAELTKSTRIRLDKDCEQLEMELRMTRDSVLMNSEKLDYNYQVLQKRNEENVIVNNQQKRRVAKLQEHLMDLRLRMNVATAKATDTVQRLSEEIRKIHAAITEMEKKSHNLRLKNKSKFDRVWAMNYRELVQNINDVNAMDKKLHEQQLLMPWSAKDIDMSDINYQLKNHKISTQRNKKPKAKDLKELPTDSQRLLQNILRQLTEGGGFLIEQRLLKIIEPFTYRDRCLVRLDNIFEALRVRSLRDIQQLTEIFAQYTYCPNCQDSGYDNRVQSCAERYVSESKIASVRATQAADQLDITKRNKQQDADVLENHICSNHYLVMEPSLVLHALTVFMTKQNYGPLSSKHSTTTQHKLNYIVMDVNQIRSFWRNFREFMPQNKLALWKKLEHGLNHYLEMLKMRQKYHDECLFLRRQNLELKHLLQRFSI